MPGETRHLADPRKLPQRQNIALRPCLGQRADDQSSSRRLLAASPLPRPGQAVVGSAQPRYATIRPSRPLDARCEKK